MSMKYMYLQYMYVWYLFGCIEEYFLCWYIVFIYCYMYFYCILNDVYRKNYNDNIDVLIKNVLKR